jgi:hypothetical protein
MTAVYHAAQRSVVEGTAPLHVHCVCRDGTGFGRTTRQRLCESNLPGVVASSSGFVAAADGASAFATFVADERVLPADLIVCADVDVFRGVVEHVRRQGARACAHRGLCYVIAFSKLGDNAGPERVAALAVALVRDTLTSGGRQQSESPLQQIFGAESGGWDSQLDVAIERAAQLRNVEVLTAVL